jgi:hypothetical protein
MSMAGLLVTVAAVAVGLGLLWRFGAFLLAVVAWFLVATMALSLVADIEVPTSAAVLAVLCWAGSQLLTRARCGYWRSALARALARRMGPRFDVGPPLAGDE